jgi:2-(3-amino-3-carboxypropyl)histidine synthase
MVDKMRILLQFPEGLKHYAQKEAFRYEKMGHEVFISYSPCWGGCDLAVDEAKKIKADKLIHYGHCEFHKVKDIKVEYKFFPIDFDITLLKKQLNKIKNFKKIALVTNISHIHLLSKIKKLLEKEGFKVYLSKGKLTKYKGQILGCDTYAASNLADKVDVIFYIGGGEFHPLGISLEKPVFVYNPFINQSYFINDKILKKEKKIRAMLISLAQAKNIGILVSTKSGQFNLKAAENIKKVLEGFNKNVFILVGSEINFESLKNFLFFDGFITTACPRLEDDFERVEKPIINISRLKELLQLLKELK